MKLVKDMMEEDKRGTYRIIQLVSLLLSMRYRRMTSCTKTLVMIWATESIMRQHSSYQITYCSEMRKRCQNGSRCYTILIWENSPNGNADKFLLRPPMRDVWLEGQHLKPSATVKHFYSYDTSDRPNTLTAHEADWPVLSAPKTRD